MSTIDSYNEAFLAFMARYARTLADLSATIGSEIAKRDLSAALSPQRLVTEAGTAQSRQELQEFNHLMELSKRAFIEHRAVAEREHSNMCLEAAPAAAELSDYFNMRVRIDLQFEISLLDCMVDFSANAIALCDLIDARRDLLEVTPTMVCFNEDDDLERYQHLFQATIGAIAEHKRIDANRKAYVAANVERLAR